MPSVTVDQLYRNIETGELPALLLLHGSETFLLQRAHVQIRKAVLGKNGDDFNDHRFDARQTSAGQLLEAAQTFPVFAERKLVTLKDAQQWPAAEMDGLLDYLADPSPHTCLLLLADKIDNRRKFWQKFAKAGTLVEFKPLAERQIPEHVKRSLEQQNLAITGDALMLFCHAAGTGLTEIHSELDKLISYVGERRLIDVADVRAIVSDNHSENIFDLGRCVALGETARALQLSTQLVAAGEPPLRILSLLVRHYRQLWQVRELQVGKSSAKEIASMVRVPPFVVDGLIRQGKRYSRLDFSRIFELFLSADMAMKSNGSRPEMVLELLVLRLSQRQFEQGQG